LWEDPREAITGLSELLTEYFDLFRAANSHRWNAAKAGKFATNVGVAALIRLLGDLITFMSAKDHEEPRELHPKVIVEKIEKYVEPCIHYFKTVADDVLEQRFNVPFGAGGQRVFQHRLREIIHEKSATFAPPGFEEDLRKYDATRRQEADRKVRDIVEAVHRFVIRRLREAYGDKDNYLTLAVENKSILTKAFEKQVEGDPEKQKDLATYLDFIDLRKIVEVPKNWAHFKDDLDIQLPDEHAGRKHIRWFDDINKLRRVSAHPYNRGYDDAEVEEIQLIYQTLIKRHLIVV
jgi:DNA sulfur modification protein DndB